jgi:hypothetical protein
VGRSHRDDNRRQQEAHPTARPGDAFDIQSYREGHFVLLRLARPAPKTRLTRAQSLPAICAAPLHPKIDWETDSGHG